MTTTPFLNQPVEEEVIEKQPLQPEVVPPVVVKEEKEEKEETMKEHLLNKGGLFNKWKAEGVSWDKNPWWERLGYEALGFEGTRRKIKPYLNLTKSELDNFSRKDHLKLRLDQAGKDLQSVAKDFDEPYKILPSTLYWGARMAPLASKGKVDTAFLGVPSFFVDAYQSLGDLGEGEYTDKPLFRWTDDFIDGWYRSIGETPRSEMTQEGREGDAFRSEMVANFLGVGIAAKIFKKARKFKFLAPIANKIDPFKATSPTNFLLRAGAFNFAEESALVFTKDTRLTGSAAGAINLIPGVDIQDPSMRPGQTRFESQLAALPYDATAAVVLGFGADWFSIPKKDLAATKELFNNQKVLATSFFKDVQSKAGPIASATREGVEEFINEKVFPNLLRAKRSTQNFIKRTETRNFLENENIIKKQEDGTYIVPGTEEAKGAENALREKYLNKDNPEVDSVIEAIDGKATDEDILEIKERQDAGENTVEVVEDVLSREVVAEVPDAEFELVTAPANSVAGSKFYDQLGQIDTESLRVIAKGMERKFTSITGKKVKDADRLDMISAFKYLEENENLIVIPSRLTEQTTVPISELNVDPIRFQYKQDVDEFGVEQGGSLSGVDKYNFDQEGIIKVWEDPADGKTYIVDGHNRRRLAEEKGIKSLKVEYIIADTAEEARGKGALANISQGSGTGLDAAKFLRDSGVTDPEALTALGVPLTSGLGSEGLALSKLPTNLFQEVVDGKLSKGKGMALGISTLDDELKTSLAKLSKTRRWADTTFNEIVQQVQNSPSPQDLIKNKKSLGFVLEKGRLAIAIQNDIKKDKTLFKKILSNAERIEETGSTINKVTGEQVAAGADNAVKLFTTQKYIEGSELNRLLDEGTNQILAGSKRAVIKNNIRRKFLETINETQLKVSKDLVRLGATKEEARQLTLTERMSNAYDKLEGKKKKPKRKELLRDVANNALKNGEARPPSSVLPTTPKVEDVNYEKAINELQSGEPGNEFSKALDNEAKLREQHTRVDEAYEADQLTAERSENGYYEKTYDEKKGDVLHFADESNFEGKAEEAVNRLVNAVDDALGKEWKGGVNTLNDFVKILNIPRVIAEESVFKAIRDVKRVASNVQQLTKGPKWLNDLDDATLKELIEHPDLPINKADIEDGDSGLKLSQDVDFTNGFYNEDEVRKGLRNVGRNMENYKLRTLQEYGARIDDYIQGRVMQSKELSREIGEAIKDAAVASGIPADRMVIFDEINMVDMFGARETSKSIRNWDTARATFMNRNPKDPLSRVAAGTTQGLYIPAQSHYKGLRSSIYIALHPLINRRYGGGGELVSEFASAMGKTFRHESFHAVQEYLDQLHMTKHLEALNQPEAIDEMVKLIKKHGGDYSPTMNNLEIQAEAYGIWATIRKAKLTKGGIVKTSFERLKKYLSEFRRKLNIIRGKDPTYIDVFELAAQGKIARQARINKLTPVQMDELIPSLNAWTQTELPDLTLRIFNYLEAKKIEYDNLISTTQNKFFTEGC